ncbi:MAG: Crp/Fnr family transcriptional regulator [Rhizobiaceae bacterium]
MAFPNLYRDDPNQTCALLKMVGFAQLGRKGVSFVDALLTKDELRLIRRGSFFGGLDDDMMASLLGDAYLLRANAGEILFMQGDVASECFIVVEGWVKLYRLTMDGNEAVVSVFARGQSFAEAAVFSMDSYPVAAEAVTACKLLRISRDVLHQEIRENPEFALSILSSTSLHLKQLVQQVEQLKMHTGAQRVARFLASLCPMDFGACNIGLPYDKTLIAGRLGMKPESLSRAFVKLRKLGVRVERNAAAIKDIEVLRQYAEGDDGRAEYHRPGTASNRSSALN